jgi:hypothetical protein
MLHRGNYEIKDEVHIVNEAPVKGLRMLGMGKEFTLGDKIIYIGAYTWTFAWTIVFLIGTYYNLTGEVSDETWMSFWRTFIIINIVASGLIILWFAIGGTRDLRDMLSRLSTMVRDHKDDGFVVRQQSPADSGKQSEPQ